MVLAVGFEDFGYRHVRCGLDFMIRVGKGNVQRGRKALADARLAGAHHADEHDVALAERASYPMRGKHVLCGLIFGHFVRFQILSCDAAASLSSIGIADLLC
jgi:hypothetical protein